MTALTGAWDSHERPCGAGTPARWKTQAQRGQGSPQESPAGWVVLETKVTICSANGQTWGQLGVKGGPGWLRSPGQGRLRLKPARVRASWMRRWPLLGPQGCWGQCQLRHGPWTPSVRVSCAGDLRGRAGGGPRAAGRQASGRASRSTLSTVPFSPIITNWTHCIFIASNFP